MVISRILFYGYPNAHNDRRNDDGERICRAPRPRPLRAPDPAQSSVIVGWTPSCMVGKMEELLLTALIVAPFFIGMVGFAVAIAFALAVPNEIAPATEHDHAEMDQPKAPNHDREPKPKGKRK